MHRLKTLLVIWFSCAVADYVEEREFIPSASMDTEDGWRVMQGPLAEELIASDPQLYLSFPKLEKQSNEIGKDFLNNDEEFRIQVADLKVEEKSPLVHDSDSLPVASSLVVTGSKQAGKEALMSPLKMVKSPPSFKEDGLIKKPFLFRNNAIYPPYSSQKFVREPLMDRFPYYDMLPQNTNLRNYQSLAQLEDPIYLPSFEYRTAPKFVPYRQMPMLDNSVEYYEIDKNARPIILKEEISYEDTPSFVSSRFPPMPRQMMFPSGSMMQKPYFKGPPLPISVKTRKIMKKPKRSMRTFSRSSSRGIPIVRGRFRV
ncbi:uncharacterized protein LOC135709137 [Ochlerotatus camptorhynchus]|uniref:uncharacterized protein LOC135709137 n=1 Tax=Ochlerotatus camptorhynchus TaxID=644619 RepID=UPI0031E003FE